MADNYANLAALTEFLSKIKAWAKAQFATKAVATTSADGLLSSTDKTKLNGIATGATAVSESTVSGWGFTKNTGTITGINMNGASKGTSGVVDLGTVITAHQDISGKLDKVTYEWNKQITPDRAGKILIGKFACYDSNVTIDINSTTNTTYHCTAILATQNIDTSGGGSFTWRTYGDSANSVTPNLYAKYTSGSNVIEIYFSPSSWSKNLIHIRAVALASGGATNICESVDLIPSTATRQPTNTMIIDSKAAASGGTDLSLVTTGEKYTWNNKQAALVSGTNIKTINSTSILGSGNIITGNVNHNTDTEAGSAATLNADQLQGYNLNQLLKLMYPIGSIYQNTTNTSPANFITGTTWSLISSVALASEHVLGNGLGLGLSDGSNTNTISLNNGSSDKVYGNVLGTSIGASGSSVDMSVGTRIVGVPTKAQLGAHPEYSGLIADTITVYTWERTA